MKIVVTGGDGQLGSCLKNCFKDHRFFFNKKKLDITNYRVLKKKLKEINPKILINTAAYTDVENAEGNSKKAFLVNKTGPRNLAILCEELSIFLIHISTDFVFNGKSKSSYSPEHKTSPINIYGSSKLAGEIEIKKNNSNYAIIRTSWLYSEYSKNFVKSIINNLKKKIKINVNVDQYGSPTSAHDLAQCIKKIVDYYKKNKIISGIYHFSGKGKTSRYIFAKKINELAFKYKIFSKLGIINPIKNINYESRAKRPLNSYLNSNKLCKLLKVKNLDWLRSLKKVIIKIASNKFN